MPPASGNGLWFEEIAAPLRSASGVFLGAGAEICECGFGER